MTDYEMDMRVGNIFAGESDQIWKPGTPRGVSKYGVILLHGAATPSQFADVTRHASVQFPAYLAERGIPCVAGLMGGDTFGNATGVARVGQAMPYLAANGPCSPDKFHLVGFSMGLANALNYAAQNPAKVASITSIIGLCDIDNIYQNNTLGLRAAIQTAWGVVHPAALPAGANLFTAAAAVKAAGIPCKMYYSDADAAITTASSLAMAAALGIEPIEYDPNNLGHTENTILAMAGYGNQGIQNWDSLIDWLKSKGA